MSYVGIENLALSSEHRSTLIVALKELGENDHPNPIRRNHTRLRSDGEAIILHGAWQTEDWTIATMKTRLGSIFGVDPASIDHASEDRSFSAGTNTRIVTFSRSAVDYLRMCEFGGVGASVPDGNAEVLGYLKANAAAWGEA